MTFTQTGQKRSAAGKEPAIDVDDSPNIQNMLRLITSEITAGQSRDDQGSQTKRDFELSFGLLTRASEVIDLLQDRCRQLEVDKKDIIEESRADMEAAHAAARQWQDLTASLKTKLDEANKQLNEMKARAENAEKRLDAPEQARRSRRQAGRCSTKSLPRITTTRSSRASAAPRGCRKR